MLLLSSADFLKKILSGILIRVSESLDSDWVQTVCKGYHTLVNVYVALPVFTRIAGTSYAYFLE